MCLQELAENLKEVEKYVLMVTLYNKGTNHKRIQDVYMQDVSMHLISLSVRRTGPGLIL